MMVSVLSAFSFKKLQCIQDLISLRQSGVGGRCDGISGDVELDVVSVAVEQKTVLADDVTEEKQVQNEEKGTKY